MISVAPMAKALVVCRCEALFMTKTTFASLDLARIHSFRAGMPLTGMNSKSTSEYGPGLEEVKSSRFLNSIENDFESVDWNIASLFADSLTMERSIMTTPSHIYRRLSLLYIGENVRSFHAIFNRRFPVWPLCPEWLRN